MAASAYPLNSNHKSSRCEPTQGGDVRDVKQLSELDGSAKNLVANLSRLESVVHDMAINIAHILAVDCKIPPFIRAYAQNGEEFIDNFEIVMGPLPDQVKVAKFVMCLHGIALDWFKLDIEPELDRLSWPDLRAKFLETFSTPTSCADYTEQYFNLKFDPRMYTISEFIVKARTLIKKMKMKPEDETTLVFDILGKLPDKIYQRLPLKNGKPNISTLAELKIQVERAIVKAQQSKEEEENTWEQGENW